MRNLWYPRGMAEYVTVSRNYEVDERDPFFGLESPEVLQPEEPTRATVHLVEVSRQDFQRFTLHSSINIMLTSSLVAPPIYSRALRRSSSTASRSMPPTPSRRRPSMVPSRPTTWRQLCAPPCRPLATRRPVCAWTARRAVLAG